MRTKIDPELGGRVYEHLKRLGLETIINAGEPDAARQYMESGVEGFLHSMGLDILNDPSIKETPRRVAEMFAYELCAGLDYANFPKCTATPNGTPVFDQKGFDEYVDKRLHAWNHDEKQGRLKTRAQILAMETTEIMRKNYTNVSGRIDEMVMLDSITTYSLCEHHFQTIAGKTHIAYIPKDKVLGVSKFARVTRFFGQRPQIQERYTEQLYAAFSFILETPDVAVQQVCSHNCIRARGAMDPHSMMTTSKLGGKFKENPALRQEFLHGIR